MLVFNNFFSRDIVCRRDKEKIIIVKRAIGVVQRYCKHAVF